MLLTSRQREVLGYVERAHAYWGDPRRQIPGIGYAKRSGSTRRGLLTTVSTSGFEDLLDYPTWVPGVTAQQISDECGEPVRNLSPILGQLRKFGAVEKLQRAPIAMNVGPCGTSVFMRVSNHGTVWALTDGGDRALRDYGIAAPLPAPAPQTLLGGGPHGCSDPEADESCAAIDLIKTVARPALRQIALEHRSDFEALAATRRVMPLDLGQVPHGGENDLSDALAEILAKRMIAPHIVWFKDRLLTSLPVVADVCDKTRPADDMFVLAAAVADGQLVTLTTWLRALANRSPKAQAAFLSWMSGAISSAPGGASPSGPLSGLVGLT